MYSGYCHVNFTNGFVEEIKRQKKQELARLRKYRKKNSRNSELKKVKRQVKLEYKKKGVRINIAFEISGLFLEKFLDILCSI